jgi:ectoine hydroxylase-related dioxygenase (phytanoyl-CoA dioxygenase family)
VDTGRFGPIDFDQFHQEELPSLLEALHFELGNRDAGTLAPLAFQLPDGRAYTFVPGPGITVVPGTAAAQTVVELADADWCAFVHEFTSSFALLYSDRLAISRGSFGQLARWEPILRMAIDGQELFDIDHPEALTDEAGEPLDLGRSFTLDDSDEEIADYLHRAGFVHLRQVMEADELDALRTHVERGIAAARPDDRRSWWTTLDGKDVCNRVNYLNEQSDLIDGLGADDRFIRIAALGGPELRDAKDRLDGNGVVIKVPGSQGGLADLPWHRDCGMGGHPVKCPMVNVGIQLDRATAATGQLLMIAGSHRGTSRLPGPHEADHLPVAALDTDPGDVTVHFGHTLHSAPPPADLSAYGRRALYLSFVPPITFEMVGPGQGYNDVLFTRDAGHVKHVDQLR